VDPKLLMLPAVLAASLGFMLPVGTAPNAIVYGSGKVPMQAMVREGAMIDLFAAISITVVCYLLLS
jgi:sodium-dependent dicarboxylate transporter 2/3/5